MDFKPPDRFSLPYLITGKTEEGTSGTSNFSLKERTNISKKFFGFQKKKSTEKNYRVPKGPMYTSDFLLVNQKYLSGLHCSW